MRWLVRLFEPKCDPTIWTAFWPPYPVNLIDGGHSHFSSLVWRKKIGGKWVYKQDPMTADEWSREQI